MVKLLVVIFILLIFRGNFCLAESSNWGEELMKKAVKKITKKGASYGGFMMCGPMCQYAGTPLMFVAS